MQGVRPLEINEEASGAFEQIQEKRQAAGFIQQHDYRHKEA